MYSDSLYNQWGNTGVYEWFPFYLSGISLSIRWKSRVESLSTQCGLLMKPEGFFRAKIQSIVYCLGCRRRLEKAPRKLVCSHRSGLQLALRANVSLTKRSPWALAHWCLLVAVQHLVHELFKIFMAVGNSWAQQLLGGPSLPTLLTMFSACLCEPFLPCISPTSAKRLMKKPPNTVCWG